MHQLVSQLGSAHVALQVSTLRVFYDCREIDFNLESVPNMGLLVI